GWGSPKSPDYRGFTPEEFQKLDFSKIDLSEFIADIIGSINVDKIQDYFIKIQKN
nr:mating pair stabilization protein [Campylobacter jejuni]